MSDHETVFQEWQQKKQKLQEKELLELQYPYSAIEIEAGLKDKTACGLAFWKFIKDKLPADKEGRSNILHHFTAGQREIVIIISLIELLPTSVWRQLLWRKNINFVSYEAFLRRLLKNNDQVEAIYETYTQLFVHHQVPNIFSLYQRIRYRITVKKLLSENFTDETRYLSKGSWVYNLANLDFGFHEYPKGTLDDTRIINKSIWDFLSVKNHVDDFVVNQEDGKYWRLYKMARNNPGWFPNRKVELQKHICPGFWYTFIILSLVFVVSPLAVGACYVSEAPDWVLYPLAALFPLWVVSAIILTVWRFILALFPEERQQKIKQKLEEWNKSSEEWDKSSDKKWRDFKRDHHAMLERLKSILAIFIMCIIMLVLSMWIFILLYKLLSFTLFDVILNLLAAYIAIGYLAYQEELPGPVWEWPWPVFTPLVSIVTYFFIKACVYQYENIIWLVSMWLEVFLSFGWISVLIFSPVLIFLPLTFAMIYYGEKFEDQVVMLLKRNKFLSKLLLRFTLSTMLAIALATVPILCYCFYVAVVTNFSIGAALYIITVFIVCYGVVWFMVYLSTKNPEVYHFGKLVSHCCVGNYSSSQQIYRLSKKNQWLMSQSVEEQKNIIDRLWNALRGASGIEVDETLTYFQLALPRVTEESLKRLEDAGHHIYCNYRYSETKRWAIIDLILSGLTYLEAQDRLVAMREEERQRKQKVKTILWWVFCPVTVPWLGLTKIWEYLFTFKKLCDLFQERCPFVTESIKLTFH
ncbi:MAG: hypothetical protein Q8Q23_03450 [bacterium]|nr:hypothetical protein [bacterium]